MIILAFFLILCGALWFFYRKSQSVKAFDRVEMDGGSALLSRDMMNFGYWALDHVATLCIKYHIRPNTISWISLVLSVICGLFLITESFQWAGVFYLLSNACDTIDGRVARRTNTASDAGEVLDATIDRWVDFVLFGALVLMYQGYTMGVCLSLLALVGAFMVSYATAKAEALRAEVPRGIMRRVERFVYMGVGIFFTPLIDKVLSWMGFQTTHHPLMLLVLALIGVLANWSALSRLYALYGVLKEKK